MVLWRTTESSGALYALLLRKTMEIGTSCYLTPCELTGVHPTLAPENPLTYCRELRLSDNLVCQASASERERALPHPEELRRCLNKAHQQLREMQWVIRSEDSEEPLLYQEVVTSCGSGINSGNPQTAS